MEGVVKFRAVHRAVPLEARTCASEVATLAGWREVLRRLGLVGQDPARYGGAGFGNLSVRVPPFDQARRGRRRFLVTGTQTGGRAAFSLADCCVVEAYDLERNEVTSVGETSPSSESLTHGAIYDAAPSVRSVFHVHSAELWTQASALGLPHTRDDVPYGTPEMAREVERLFREGAVHDCGIFAMGGHEDGVIAFGESADAAGTTLVLHWARAVAAERAR